MKKILFLHPLRCFVALVMLIMYTVTASAQTCNTPPPSEFIASTSGNTLQLTWTPVSGVAGYFLEVFDFTTSTLFFSTSLPNSTTSFVVSGLQPSHQYVATLRVICPGGCVSTIATTANGGIIVVEDVVLIPGIDPCGLNCTTPAGSAGLQDTILYWPNSADAQDRMLFFFALKKNGVGSVKFRIARNNDNQSFVMYQDCNASNNNCNCFVQNDTIYCTTGNTVAMNMVFRTPNQVIIKTFDNWSARYKSEICTVTALENPDPEATERAQSPQLPSGNISGLQCQPNPGRERISIGFQVTDPAEVDIRLVNIYGEAVMLLADGAVIPSGNYFESFDISSLPSGIYFAEIRSAEVVLINKLIVER